MSSRSSSKTPLAFPFLKLNFFPPSKAELGSAIAVTAKNFRATQNAALDVREVPPTLREKSY